MTAIKSLKPKEAYAALQGNPAALLIDVRDTLESNFVGHPVGAVNIPWKDWSNRQWQANPNFIAQVAERAPNKAAPLFLMCRSGQRSLEAAKALLEAGYTDLTNIEEGFEGGLDENKHRSTVSGWRCHGLPWQQS
ncbi:rhodanese-like domain-containing protein [Methylogaea oryzae]|uniref:Rhodanese n=1 Tax=Methylogaea oryzae TaxID=1295382 RepID=A0A8D4VRA3_9GAMM|nr:rhodanese-like domain-containing protein [Methylogaea oryzae]BBL72381.1 rhodanese [Methylogaea oryzae]